MVFRAIVPHEDGSAERIGIGKGQVTSNFFLVLGAHIVYGRDFTEGMAYQRAPYRHRFYHLGAPRENPL